MKYSAEPWAPYLLNLIAKRIIAQNAPAPFWTVSRPSYPQHVADRRLLTVAGEKTTEAGEKTTEAGGGTTEAMGMRMEVGGTSVEEDRWTLYVLVLE